MCEEAWIPRINRGMTEGFTRAWGGMDSPDKPGNDEKKGSGVDCPDKPGNDGVKRVLN